jgi:hypothetical protein
MVSMGKLDLVNAIVLYGENKELPKNSGLVIMRIGSEISPSLDLLGKKEREALIVAIDVTGYFVSNGWHSKYE